MDERTPARAPLAAAVLALTGVVIMCGGGSLSIGHALGDLLALAMTGLMALMMVIIHKNRRVSMLPATCLSAFACAVAVLPMARPLAVTAPEFLLLALSWWPFCWTPQPAWDALAKETRRSPTPTEPSPSPP